jgi:DNA (cytosine-5)-methyltransferase 1
LRSGSGGSDKPHVMTELAVRRLTPRETERLQGLPDDYTLIPYGKGARQKDIAEMAAYWGVTVEEAATLAADSHRYRAVGNGMAAPVVRWIGERIELILFMQSVFRRDQG